MNTAHSTIPALTEIAIAQASRTIFAFDRAAPQRLITRLQQIYADKLAQLEAFHYLFDEGTPDIALRNGTREVVLRLPELGEVYAALRDRLETELRDLEKEIVVAHLDLAEEVSVRAIRDGKPDYVPAILALCVPTAPQAMRLAPEQSTAHAHAA